MFIFFLIRYGFTRPEALGIFRFSRKNLVILLQFYGKIKFFFFYYFIENDVSLKQGRNQGGRG